MFYCSASSSEKQDRTTVPTACSTVLPPLQRSKTGPRSPQHVLQFCPLQRSMTGPRPPQHVLQFCLLFREARRQQWPHGATLQEQLWGIGEDLLKTTAVIQTTGHLRQSHAETQKKSLAASTFFVSWDVTHSRCRCQMTAGTPWFIITCLVVTSWVFNVRVYKTIMKSVSVLLVIQLGGYLPSCVFACLCSCMPSFLCTEI